MINSFTTIYKGFRMLLDNASYDKIKLVHEISRIIWFIDKHALVDANNAGDMQYADILIGLRKDLERHLQKLQTSVCIISQ